MFKKTGLFLLALMLLIMPASAQDFGVDTTVDLEPFFSRAYGIQGFAPDWAEAQTPGIYLRQRDVLDLTAMIIQAGAVSRDDLIATLQAQFGLDAMPDPVDTLENDAFTWDLYRVQRTQGAQTLEMDIAITSNDDITAFVLMQTAEIFYDGLHENAFLPVVESITPLRSYEDPNDLFAVPVPPLWTLEEGEDYGAMTSPDDEVTIYLGAAETTNPEEALVNFWQRVDPEFVGDYEESDVRSPENVGDLDSVTIIDFEDGTEFVVQQGVAREYDGVVYMILIDSNTPAIRANDAAIGIVDGNLVIAALASAQADAAESESEGSTDSD